MNSSALNKNIRFLVSTTEAGFSMYFYVRIHAGKEMKFFKEMCGDAFVDMKMYADILESGVGTLPSLHSVELMQQKYGFTTPPEVFSAQ